VFGQVKPCEDESRLDFRDAPRAEAADFAQLASRVQLHDVADRARLTERRAVGAGQRVEGCSATAL
jgi:hypothetical protein